MAKNSINSTETVEILQAILDSIGDAVLVAFKDAHVMRLNPAAENIFGRELRTAPLSEWLNLHGFFLPDRVSPCPTEERPLVRALRGESFDDVELFICNNQLPDGIFVSITGRPMRDSLNNVIGGAAGCYRKKEVRRKSRDADSQVC
jgi:two-component system, sensor histidine kinase and response regulator